MARALWPLAMASLISPEQVASARERDRAVRILAKSLFKELRQNGYSPKELVALSTELLDLVTSEIRPHSTDEDGAD
jgi:hypothetical protein